MGGSSVLLFIPLQYVLWGRFLFFQGVKKLFYKTRKISFLNHGKREKGNEETTEAKKLARLL